MKRFLVLIGLLLMAVSAHAQTQFVEIDISESVGIQAMTIAGAPITTNFTTWTWILEEVDGMSTTLTVGTGTGNNQCTAETHGLRCHFTMDQLGNNKLSWYSSSDGVILGFTNLFTIEAASMGNFRDGNNIPLSSITTVIETELDDRRLNELLFSDSDIDGAAPPTVGSVFHELMTKTAGSFTFDQTTDSLEANRDNVGTGGAGMTGLATSAQVIAIDDFIDTEIAAIQTLVTSIEGQTDDIGIAGVGLTALASQASVTAVDDYVDTEIAALGTLIASVEAQTDDIGVAGAGLTAIPLRTIVKNTAFVAYVTMFTSTGQRDTALTAGGMTCVMDLDGADSPVVITGTKTEVDDTSMPGVWIVGVPAGTMNFDSGAMVCRSGTSFGGAMIQPQR